MSILRSEAVGRTAPDGNLLWCRMPWSDLFLNPKQPQDMGRDGTNTAAVIYIVVLVIGGIWLFRKLMW